MKETCLQGLKDQLAGADEDTTGLQVEIEELEQRITELTSCDPGPLGTNPQSLRPSRGVSRHWSRHRYQSLPSCRRT